MKGKYHDISLDLSHEIIVYPGDPCMKIIEDKDISKGDFYNLSILTFGSHTGTHIDAPKHFYNDGLTIDELSLDYFVGKAIVLEVKDKFSIGASDLAGMDIKKDDIVLLKTRNSSLINKPEFSCDYTYIEPDAAEYFVNKGIKTLGFDYLSVEKYGSKDPEIHYTLLKQNIVIIEGLCLNGINPGEYFISALPLKIRGGNGSPARVLLIENQ